RRARFSAVPSRRTTRTTTLLRRADYAISRRSPPCLDSTEGSGSGATTSTVATGVPGFALAPAPNTGDASATMDDRTADRTPDTGQDAPPAAGLLTALEAA